MRQRISSDAVRPALQQQKFGLETFQMTQNLVPGRREGRIVRARRERQVELGAYSLSPAALIGAAGAGIEKSTIFMDVGEDHLRIVLESVKHAIAVVCVDVDVGNAREPVRTSKPLDGDTTIVKRAKPGRPAAPGMVEPGDRDESASGLARHDGRRRLERAPDDV